MPPSACGSSDRLSGQERPPPLHAKVCIAAREAFERGGEQAARRTIRTYFEDKVMLRDARETEYQLRAGVCQRMTLPSTRLRQSQTS